MSETQIELSVQASRQARRPGSTWPDAARRRGAGRCWSPTTPAPAPPRLSRWLQTAAVTSTLRLGSYVVNAGVRNPLLLAGEVATLDVVSNGRAELGIGAGHTPAEWAMTGRTRPPPAERVQDLIVVTTVVRELLAGRTVPADAARAMADVLLSGPRPVQEPVPVLVGGGNPALLRWGGAHADAVGLSGLGRTLPDGHAHAVSWSPEQLDAQVDLVREGAAGAGIAIPPLEALVQHVELTDNRTSAARPLARETGLSVDDLLAVPYVLIGTIAQIVQQLRDARERWGITRWVVRIDALDVAEQVLAALRS